MITLNRLWHETVLGHGAAWVELIFRDEKISRSRGVLISCTCGKRWLSRAPWDRVQ